MGDATKPKQIACENKGIWYSVGENDDIGSIMSNYYMYFAKALAHTKQVRWTMYKEYKTENELFTGCLPAYRREVGHEHLLGVVCMDASIVIDVDLLKVKSDFTVAEAEMRKAATLCNKVTLSE